MRAPRTLDAYGPGPRQHGEWWLPAQRPRGTVVLVHGGFWRPVYDKSLEDPVAADLSARGWLVWNIEYAAADAPWPATLTDVAAAYDWLLTGRHGALVDPARVAVVGHSAGGHLALWLGSRHRLPAAAPGGAPAGPRPALVVAQAPVAALRAAAEQRLGAGAVETFVGGAPADVPERYDIADPVALLPTGGPTVLVHGVADEPVPVSHSEAYVAAARAAGDDARLVTYDGGHFEHLDPASDAIRAMHQALDDLG